MLLDGVWGWEPAQAQTGIIPVFHGNGPGKDGKHLPNPSQGTAMIFLGPVWKIVPEIWDFFFILAQF